MKKLILTLVLIILSVGVASAVVPNGNMTPKSGNYNATYYCLPKLWEENSPTLDNEIVPLGNFVLAPNAHYPTSGQKMTFNIYGPSAASYNLVATFTPNATDGSEIFLDATWTTVDGYGTINYPNSGNLNTPLRLIPNQNDDCNSWATLSITSIQVNTKPILFNMAQDYGVKYFHVTVSVTANL